MPTSLAKVTAALDAIAPPELAEEWDNTGLVVESPDVDAITHCTLTIDLSEAVLEEAIAHGSQLIVAYHPPMFRAVRRLNVTIPHQRVILRAIRHGISLYSPHTALDAAPGGVNDWLCDAFPTTATRESIPTADGEPGIGRLVRLAEPTALDECCERIKAHLGLDRIRVAAASDRPVSSIALCAGAGASVLTSQVCDLYWTGEMRHHDVLDAVYRGTSVVLCDHTNTERGYLPTLHTKLAEACPELDIAIANTDVEPLQVR